MFKLVSLGLILGLSFAASSARANTVYDVNISYDSGQYTVVGTITTDGATSLTASDIIAYNLTATNPFDEVIHATNLGSSESLSGKILFSDQTNDLALKGTALTSDGTNLTFDFASPNFDELRLGSIEFVSTFDQLLISGKGGHYDDPIIGVAETPIPSSLPLFVTGVAFVLLLSNRKNKNLLGKSEAFRAA